MRILHHIALRAGEQERAVFLDAGVELGSGARSAGIVSFEITEDDPRWQKIHSVTQRLRVFDTVTTQFNSAELEAAESLGIVSSGLHGYPEPSDNAGYLAATFDLSHYCRTCGTGAKGRTTEFRIRPAHRRRLLLTALEGNPAHQVKVNGAVVYSYEPPRNDSLYIASCFGVPSVNGATGAVVVPAH